VCRFRSDVSFSIPDECLSDGGLMRSYLDVLSLSSCFEGQVGVLESAGGRAFFLSSLSPRVVSGCLLGREPGGLPVDFPSYLRPSSHRVILHTIIRIIYSLWWFHQVPFPLAAEEEGGFLLPPADEPRPCRLPHD